MHPDLQLVSGTILQRQVSSVIGAARSDTCREIRSALPEDRAANDVAILVTSLRVVEQKVLKIVKVLIVKIVSPKVVLEIKKVKTGMCML